jgi:hypothetical protein
MGRSFFAFDQSAQSTANKKARRLPRFVMSLPAIRDPRIT